MKILYFTVNMKNYTSARYQQDLINSLEKKCEVFFWGPGFKNFNIKYDIDQIKEIYNFSDYDPIIVGHSWISDIPFNKYKNKKNYYKWINEKDIDKNSLEYCGQLDFKSHKGPKIFLLNKEYISLDQKLKFAKKNEFNFVLSSNTNYKKYEKITKIKFIHFPYAIRNEFLQKTNIKKKYDLFFSGLIQNPYFYKIKKEKSKRLIIQDKLFYSPLGIPFLKKKNEFNIYWNIYTGIKFKDFILKFMRKYKRMPENEYIIKLNESRVVLNTLSPDNLIGPRFYETMASKAICLTEESEILHDVFKPMEHYVPLEKGENILEKLRFCLSDSKEINNIIDNAFNYVKSFHTYERRSQQILEIFHK